MVSNFGAAFLGRKVSKKCLLASLKSLFNSANPSSNPHFKGLVAAYRKPPMTLKIPKVVPKAAHDLFT